MKIALLEDPERVAARAAAFVAEEAREAVAARSRFVFAVSGGRTPSAMLRALAREVVPWDGVHLVQVDERVAPAGHPDRNLTHLSKTLLEHVPIRSDQFHAMPVEEKDLVAATSAYARGLRKIAGSPPVLDLVHLGLGADGQTASLVPGEPVLDIVDIDVALTDVYQSRRRMTLTYRVINRSRRILWLMTGWENVPTLPRLRAADALIADRAALGSGSRCVRGLCQGMLRRRWRVADGVSPKTFL